jgi:hypothetical protein
MGHHALPESHPPQVLPKGQESALSGQRFGGLFQLDSGEIVSYHDGGPPSVVVFTW